MTARPFLAALVIAAASAPASAATSPAQAPRVTGACRGITDDAGDTGVFFLGPLRAPTPAPSLDIVQGAIDVGPRTTTFRVSVDDLATQAADGAAGADWQWLLKTRTAEVVVVARVEPAGGETFVRRDDTHVYTGPAPVLDVAKNTVTWTVPTATLTKAGLTPKTTVAPTISTWRGTVGHLPDEYPRLHADFAEGRSVPWGRVGC